tara:strand:+ start:306 stop:752 length:447 start_codon:yes stop_codon:yes gene_type:complete
MKDQINKVSKEWNQPISEAQKVMECHAPVVSNDKPTLIHRDTGMLYFHMLNEELNEFRAAVQDEESDKEARLIEVADALIDLTYIINGALDAYGLGKVSEELFNEVHRSNLTKIPNGNVILNEDGKVQKPKDTYEAPNLSAIIFPKND